MFRKLSAMFLLSLLLIAFVAVAVVQSADKQVKRTKDRASVPARLAPTYSFPGLTGSEYTPPPPAPTKVNLRGSRGGEGIIETLGTTTYGYQSNCTMGRQAEHRAGYSDPFTPYGHYIHFDWMSQVGAVLGDGRGVGYQAYDIKDCGIIFDEGGIRIEGDYAGYVTMDAHNIDYDNSWAVPGAHEMLDGDYYSRGYWDFPAGGPVFGVFTNDYSTDNDGHYLPPGEGQNIWPKIEWDIDGTEHVLHLVASEFGGEAGDPQTSSYYRRVGPYGTGLGVWADQHVLDTVMNINVTIASSPISDRVAIAWNAPVDYKRDTPTEFDNQYENDVWYAMVDDNGAAWAAATTNLGNPSIADGVVTGTYSGGNITNYSWDDDYKAYCDMSAIFALTTDVPNDELHIVWGCRRWTDTTSLYRRQSAIFHWRETTGDIKTVVKADWDTGGACYAYAWGSDVAKMTISECDGKMYVCYTQFGDKEHPCHWFDSENTVVSGYLYLTVYDPLYSAWDRAQRVTAITEGPTGCTAGDMTTTGDCNSEYWSSMARYGRMDSCKTTPPGNVLDIVYINDLAPGGCVQTESGVWAVNPVNWAVYPCREAVPEPGYSDDAGPGYGLCVGEPILVLGTTDDTTFTLTLENPGILVNNPVNIAVNITAAASGNTSVTCTPNTGLTIAAAGGEVEVTVQITTTGEDNNVTVEGNITVTHQAGDSPPTDRVIPFCLTVSDDWVPLDFATLNTFCKKLKVYSNGEMSNNALNESMDFTDIPGGDGDTCATVYLYDASPVVCIDRDHCYFAVYDNDYGSDHALRQVSPMFYDNVSNPDYEYATAEFITGDSAVGLIVEYFAPKAEENCCFIIQKLKFWNRGEVTLDGIAVGEALDWDIPNYDADHAASDNESGFDASRNLIYQYTCWNDECDTLVPADRAGGIASYKDGDDFKNYMTLENDVYVYSTGPYGNDAPMPDSAIYDLMTGVDGPDVATLDSCEDLFTLVTFDVYELGPGDAQCVVKILTTSKDDGDIGVLKQNVDNANAFIDAHEEIMCPVTDPCAADPSAIPGDANGDGSVNVGDAVYTISYVFKGGPAPTPYPVLNGDGNGDCATNVGDAVYTISYVFKGGPPPVSCQEWLATCGPPLR